MKRDLANIKISRSLHELAKKRAEKTGMKLQQFYDLLISHGLKNDKGIPR
jgi:hypothetical protein